MGSSTNGVAERQQKGYAAGAPALSPPMHSRAVTMPKLDPPKTEYMQRRRQRKLVRTARAEPINGRSRDWADTRMTSTLLRDARQLAGRCGPIWVGLAEVELSPSGLARYMWPLVLYTALLLTAAVAMIGIIYWIPGYRLYWSVVEAPGNATQLINLSSVSSMNLLETAPMPPHCHRFEKNSVRLTAGVDAMLDSAIQTPYAVEAVPNNPHTLAPGMWLVLRSLVVEEVSHGRWSFGLCWTRPWYETMPDQLVLRMRGIGMVATLTMQVGQARGAIVLWLE
jgi:hypothetical protein